MSLAICKRPNEKQKGKTNTPQPMDFLWRTSFEFCHPATNHIYGGWLIQSNLLVHSQKIL